MLEDSKIIALFFARTDRAIAELSAKYGAVCVRIARNILHNAQDAEECVNDAYLAAWNTIPPKTPDPLKTYLFRLVRNISITKYHANTSLKRNSLYDAALDELENCLATLGDVEDEMAESELQRHLNQFLSTLDPETRVMFVRRYWYSDSLSAIAERFHTNNHRISVRLSRTREKLKQYLQKEGYTL